MATLEERIAARLDEALDRMVAAGTYLAEGQRGLADFDDGDDVTFPRLSIADVARIAADEARR